MEHLSQRISDLFGLIHKNLLRSEDDPVVISSNSRNAVLAVLYRKGPLPMNVIGEHLRVTKANITFLVDKLEKQNLTQRERSNDDRRVVNIKLTEKGRQLIKNERILRIARIKSHLEKLPPGEIEELDNAINTITRILQKI